MTLAQQASSPTIKAPTPLLTFVPLSSNLTPWWWLIVWTKKATYHVIKQRMLQPSSHHIRATTPFHPTPTLPLHGTPRKDSGWEDPGYWPQIGEMYIKGMLSMSPDFTSPHSQKSTKFLNLTYLVFLNEQQSFDDPATWSSLQVSQAVSSFVQFTCSVVSDSLQSRGLQHARFPCPSPTSRACSNSYPISSSVIPFSSCLQSFPASGSFLNSQLFASGGQSIGASASTSVLSMNIQH